MPPFYLLSSTYRSIFSELFEGNQAYCLEKIKKTKILGKKNPPTIAGGFLKIINPLYNIFSFTQSISSFRMVCSGSLKISCFTFAPIFSINSAEALILERGT